SYDERVVAAGEGGEEIGLRAGDVDRALARERDVVEVQHLVVERLQPAFGDGDQADGQVEAGQPRRGLEQLGDVVEVALDVGARADAADAGDQADGGVRLRHRASLSALGHVTEHRLEVEHRRAVDGLQRVNDHRTT